MLVIATKKGYYKRIREPGEKFEYPLKRDIPMPTWMKQAGKSDAPEAAPTTDDSGYDGDGSGDDDPLA